MRLLGIDVLEFKKYNEEKLLYFSIVFTYILF